MAQFDAFNGDADGICALIQLRHARPVDSVLVTGVKRDIQLVDRIEAGAGDRVTVLDVSFDKNRAGVQRLLDAGASVFYADHHFAGEIAPSDHLTALIDTSPNVCTSLLINRHLGGRFAQWAVTGAFGDNLEKSARALAAEIGLDERQQALLRDLGTYINYNGYGAAPADLHFAPADLFARLRPHRSPFDFIAEDADSFGRLEAGYREDMASAAAVAPSAETAKTAVYFLPDAAWARRVSGVYSNDLANASPDRAHAVLGERSDGSYLVSVRAPLSNKAGADELCRRFPSGGGRAAAAGINDLPADQRDAFTAAFEEFYGS